MPFLLKYLFVAILGTTLLYCCIPLIHPELYAGESESEVAEPASLAESASPLADNGASVAARQSPSREALARVKRQTPAQVKDVPEAPAPAAVTEPEAEEAEVIVENVVDYTPSTDVIRLSGSGVTHWGITVKETPAYSKEGKNLKQIPAGSLIEQINSTTSDKGEMAFCKVWGDGYWSGPYLIAGANLFRFSGTREQTDAADVEKLCRYYSLIQKHENRKNEILKASASKNPHYKEFKEKAEAYNRNAERAAELTKQRDDAKGPKRNKIIAELTKLKQEESRQAAELNRIKTKYEDWKKKNGQELADYNSDPLIQSLGKQILDLKYELSDFGI